MRDWTMMLHHARGQGKTIAMVDACKKFGAILVCQSAMEAKRVSKTYGIKTATVDTCLRGVKEIILFDPDVVGVMASEYERALAVNTAEIKRLRDKYERFQV